MKRIFVSILYLLVFQIAGSAQISTEILPILLERVEVGKTN